VKAIAVAEDDGIRDEAGQAAATGLTVRQVREAQAAAALRPASLDDHATGASTDTGMTLADEGADVEGQVVVSGIMSGFLRAYDSLPAIQQVLLAFVFHRELELDVAAEAVFLEPAEARRQLEAAVCAVHQGLLMSVSGEGTGSRTAPVVYHVSSADRGTALESAGAVPWKRCAECLQRFPVEAFNFINRAAGRRCSYCKPCDRRLWRARHAARAAAVGVRLELCAGDLPPDLRKPCVGT
jgi:hypothetical protein